jgi:hypothetical protein
MMSNYRQIPRQTAIKGAVEKSAKGTTPEYNASHYWDLRKDSAFTDGTSCSMAKQEMLPSSLPRCSYSLRRSEPSSQTLRSVASISPTLIPLKWVPGTRTMTPTISRTYRTTDASDQKYRRRICDDSTSKERKVRFDWPITGLKGRCPPGAP